VSMQGAVLLFASLLFVVSRASQAVQGVIAADANNGEFRALAAYASPSFANANAIALIGVKSDLSVQSSTTGGQLNAQLDAAKFIFTTPALSSSSSLAFYLGVLDVSAQANFQAGAGVVASVSGALCEVVASVSKIVVWQENNKNPGLQFDLANVDVMYSTACTNQSKTDCIDDSVSIDLTKITWSAISWSTQPCPTGNYQPNCTVYTFGTNGYQTGVTAPVISFTFVTANQNIMYNYIEVGPDRAKIDVDIAYPWTGYVGRLTSPSIALYAGAAGRLQTGAAVGIATQTGIAGAITFSGTGSHVTHFDWVPTATVDGNAGQTVYVATETISAILGFNCTGCSLVTGTVVAVLKVYALGWKLQGWDGALAMFSWTAVKPGQINWDPSVMQQTAVQSTTTSHAASVVPSVLLAILLLALFVKRWE